MGYTFQASKYWIGIIFTSKVYQWGIFFTPKSIWMGKIWKIVYEWVHCLLYEVYEWVCFSTSTSIWIGWHPGTPTARPYPKSWQVTPPPPLWPQLTTHKTNFHSRELEFYELFWVFTIIACLMLLNYWGYTCVSNKFWYVVITVRYRHIISQDVRNIYLQFIYLCQIRMHVATKRLLVEDLRQDTPRFTVSQLNYNQILVL